MIKKQSIIIGAIGLAIFAGGVGSGISLASGKMEQVAADLVPFYWKAGDSTFSAVDGYNDGTTKLPGSLNYKGTTYIPIRLLAETLGYEVDWDDATKTATVLDPAHSDDPASDLPTPTPAAYVPNAALLKSSAVLLDKPSDQAAVIETLTANTKVEVTSETNSTWLEVTAGGKHGYVSASATDYRYKADRPAWERKADGIIATGLKFLGTPYQFGASTKQTNTFDCSSFTKYIFGQNGITLPRDSRQQSQTGQDIDLSNLRKGDLIFFTTPQRKNETGLQHIGHVAMYVGDNKLLHTFRVGIGVTVTELDDNWKKRIVSIKRIIN